MPGVNRFTYDQVVPSLEWVVDHNLSGYPAVTTVDADGNVIQGSIHYDTSNRVTITFTEALVGKAYFS